MKLTTLAAVLILFASFAGGVSASIIVLDDTNNFTSSISPNVTVSQPSPTSGRIEFSGATLVLGLSDTADFSTGAFSRIGGNAAGTGVRSTLRPQDFVNGGTDFTIRDDTTGTLFDAELTFFRARGGQGTTVGTPPSPNDNNAALVLQFSSTAVPEPSAATLLAIASLGLARRRRR